MSGGRGITLPQASGGGGGAVTPNIAALPLGDHSIGDWNGFPGPSWAINSAWTDTTGAVLRRVSDSTHVGLDSQSTTTAFNCEYASNGPLISRAFGASLDTYHIIGWDWGANNAYVFDYKRGSGAVAGTKKTLPIGNTEALCSVFSTNSSDSAHIMYLSDRAAGSSTLHRYDISAPGYSANAIFTGGSASYVTGQDTLGWLQTNWSGSHLVFAAPYGGSGTFGSLDLNTGTMITHTSATTNEVKIGKGATKVVTFCDGSGGRKFWFVAANHLTATVSGGSTQTHSNMGETQYYIMNSDSANFEMAVYDPGTDPGSDGGTWNGSLTNRYNAGGGTQTLNSDAHPQMSWNQTGAGSAEWFCQSVCLGSGAMSATTATAWSVDSGNIYKSAVGYGSGHYSNSTIGISAVRLLTSGNITGKLNAVASYGALVAGTFFHDVSNSHGGGAGELYAWLPGGGDPTGIAEILAQAILSESVGYSKLDGTERRRLCYTYRRDPFDASGYAYAKDCYANWSPDGLIVTFGSNFGVPGGRVDMVVAEVPHT